MAKIAVEEDYAATADAVWQKLADFGVGELSQADPVNVQMLAAITGLAVDDANRRQ